MNVEHEVFRWSPVATLGRGVSRDGCGEASCSHAFSLVDDVSLDRQKTKASGGKVRFLRALRKNKRAANPLLTRSRCQADDILYQRVQTGSGFRGYSRLLMAVETPRPTALSEATGGTT